MADPDTTTGSEGSDATATATSTSGDATTGDSTTTAATTTSGDATTDDSTTGAIQPGADQLFTDAGVSRFELTLEQTAIDALSANPSTYVPADGHIELADGTTFDLQNLGVRLKGRYGSFRTLDQKAAFLLRFDAYNPDQEPMGLEKLALNNMVQDGSMIHEHVAYALFRAAGVPAPRTGYARVFVNRELYGLYALVEPADNNVFLDDWFGDHDQNLYEGAYGNDFYVGWGSSFDQDNGTDVGFADLEALAVALDAMVTPDTYLTDASLVIDMPHYLQFAATEIFIGHWDGYAWTRNNYSVYRAPDSRWSFIPWGTDQTFGDFLPIWGGEGRIEQMCVQSLPCRAALRDAFADVVARVDTLALVDYCDQLRMLIEEPMQEDPRKEYGPDDVHYGIDMTKQFLIDRQADVLAQSYCADPTAIDDDGDGAWGCGYDCDDGDPGVYPGAPELCNLTDDDCNGLLDDDPDCPPCAVSPATAGHSWGFCFQPLDYDDARTSCQDQGGELASIHSQQEHDEIWTGASSQIYGSWWIGLDDQLVEGSFEWRDGTALDYQNWAGGEPNDYDANEDCGHLADWAGGAWNDIPCNNAMPYVCWLP